MKLHLPLFVILGLTSLSQSRSIEAETTQYEPNWDSLDTRPLPAWYDEAKIGIFIHWGVFSVPSFKNEWFWDNWITGRKGPDYAEYMKNNFRPNFTYADFAKDFTAEFFDPVSWASLFKDAGAKYIVFVSKHHEGFCNWATDYSFNWNSMDVGPNRDIVGELSAAIRDNTDIKFGLYHSLLEWFHPLYLQDAANDFKTQHFVSTKCMPELHELVTKYQPEVIWSDGDWTAPDSYWNSTNFLAWLYNESPVKDTVVVNDRWGNNDIRCHHGDFWNCKDRYFPDELQTHKWESCYTVDRSSWGLSRVSNLSMYLSPEEIISSMAKVVANGGNVLFNVGPAKDGTIIPIQEERLRQLGAWLGINGEAIYASRPWTKQNDTITAGVWYTWQVTPDSNTVYAIVTSWPVGSELMLGVPKPAETTVIRMLGYDKPLLWSKDGDILKVPFPKMQDVTSQWAWTLSFTNLQN